MVAGFQSAQIVLSAVIKDLLRLTVLPVKQPMDFRVARIPALVTRQVIDLIFWRMAL